MPSSNASGQPSARLAHTVLFTLKDKSDAARDALVASCVKYLTDHPGTVFFGAGPRAAQYARPVNDTGFDVALHLIFATAEDHDRYQQSDRHQQFIAENKPNWESIRVTDAFV